jgi:5-methylcytosine-specific restriction endonuclease McrA
MPHADPEAGRAYHRRYYQENRERIAARARAWDAANPERAKARAKAWRAANAERERARHRERYLENREEIIAQVRERELRLLNEQPEVLRAQNRDKAARRRVRLRAALVEKVDALLVWERDAGLCGICGEAADPTDWHLDHIVPVSRGGEHSYANVQVTHPFCNRRKAAS